MPKVYFYDTGFLSSRSIVSVQERKWMSWFGQAQSCIFTKSRQGVHLGRNISPT